MTHWKWFSYSSPNETIEALFMKHKVRGIFIRKFFQYSEKRKIKTIYFSILVIIQAWTQFNSPRNLCGTNLQTCEILFGAAGHISATGHFYAHTNWFCVVNESIKPEGLNSRDRACEVCALRRRASYLPAQRSWLV